MQAVDLVKQFEGLRRRAARLPEGGWTIGYGHTASARRGASVSSGEAEALLLYDLNRVAAEVDALVFTPISQNQFDALVSFAFNIGVGNFRGSTVLKRINEGRLLQAASALELWRKAMFEGEDLVLDALVRRRAAEKALFLTPPEGFRAAPTPLLPPLFDPQVGEAVRGNSGRYDPTVLDANLTGDVATLAREGAPPPTADDPAPATRAALATVSFKLQQLLAEDYVPESEPVQGVLEEIVNPEQPPPPMARLWDADAPPIDDATVPIPPAREAVTPAPADPEEAPLHLAPAEDAPLETSLPAPAIAQPPEGWRRAKLYLGIVGLLLFGGAILVMFQDKATLLNLLVGLVGIMLMTPAAVVLIGSSDEVSKD